MDVLSAKNIDEVRELILAAHKLGNEYLYHFVKWSFADDKDLMVITLIIDEVGFELVFLDRPSEIVRVA